MRVSLKGLAIAASVGFIFLGTSCTVTEGEQVLPEPNVESVWNHLQEARYRSSWNLFPGTQAFQEGGAPQTVARTAMARLNRVTTS